MIGEAGSVVVQRHMKAFVWAIRHFMSIAMANTVLNASLRKMDYVVVNSIRTRYVLSSIAYGFSMCIVEANDTDSTFLLQEKTVLSLGKPTATLRCGSTHCSRY